MMIDLRNVSKEEVLLKTIHNRVEHLLKAVRKYLVYKIITANKETTCKEFDKETEYQKKLFDVLNEYIEKEKMKQDLFDILHKEAAKFKENDNENKID